MIYPITMYAAKCDCCGEEVKLMGEFAALVDELSVREDLMESGYHTDGNKHYCPGCWSYDDEDNIVIKPKKEQQ